MKLLAALSAFVGATVAFSNTAPLYASWNLDQKKPIARAEEITEYFSQASQEWCSADTQPTVIFRVKNLSSQHESKQFLVMYRNAEELDLVRGSPCDVDYSVELPSSITPGKLYVVDLDDDTQHSVQELLSENYRVIVQGKPHELEGNKVRDHDENEDDMFEEANDDFSDAMAMLSESGDSEVTVLAEQESKNGSLTDASVFTSYQFFTPGLWLCIIVVLFLVYVTSTAIHWTASIQTSYNAFEKQVDFQKKTE